jgi:P27 family predicted phage terminase small subunit
MGGPPPTPIPLRILRGNPSKRRIPRPIEPARSPEPPQPPPFLRGHALDEWHRIAPGLHVLGLLSTIDTMPLAAYCQSYKIWREAVELLSAMAEHDQTTHALLIKGAKKNPLVAIAASAAADMVRYASEFGAAPAARARIAAGVGREPGKFDGLIGG